MRIVEIREKTVPISRYADPSIPSGGLNTSLVAIITDVIRDGAPLVGYGFASFGRFGQGGLIRERFAPRLLNAAEGDLLDQAGGNLDPFKAWTCMMRNEKPGGHGERCVAVGTLDMALWDVAAKISEKPLYAHLGDTLGKDLKVHPVPVYAGGGYLYPIEDIHRLTEEIRQVLDLGYTRVKIKIGNLSLEGDITRIEAALKLLPESKALAVDAMNRYQSESALRAAKALEPYHLLWFEDACDPLDFETQKKLGLEYNQPLAAGEALFSAADARNLIRYGGLRPGKDVLVFDPVHCYGLPGYIQIIEMAEAQSWSPKAFQPHGGHLFSLHIAAALGLGGCESNPLSFLPFGGFGNQVEIHDGMATPPLIPGIGFETQPELLLVFQSLLETESTH